MAKINYKVNGTLGEEHRLPCVTCSGTPVHHVMASFDEKGSHDEGDNSYEWNDHYQIVQCQGCKNISFRDARTNSEDYFQISRDEFEHAVTEELFPSRLAGRKGIDKEMRIFLPPDIGVIYNETIRAMANQSPVLAGIGLRALLETVCKEKQAAGKDLSNKIDDLQVKSVLTPTNAAVLHRIRTLGNDAAHEVKPHTEGQLGVAMDVMENLLREVYILPKQFKSEFD